MQPLPLHTYLLLRISYGILLFIFFSLILPFSKAYFTSETYKGCIRSTKFNDLFFSPFAYYVILCFWMLAALLLALGHATLPAALVNVCLCRLFFIQLRWSTPLRGMGAPGFISYWIALLVFLVEYSLHFGDSHGELYNLIIMAFRWDYGIMMIDSGINKIFHGYARDRGMNYGMANPAWGYGWKFFSKLPANHPFFRFLNHSAYASQILAGVLMLIPPTQWLGAFLIFGIFLQVKFLIRLGVLCDMLMLITLIFTKTGGWFEAYVMRYIPSQTTSIPAISEWTGANTALSFVLWAYIMLLPLAKLGMYYNFYLKKTFPKLLQKALETFTNACGVILWRVFTIDLIDFFIRVYFLNPETGERTLYTRYGAWKWNQTNRFLWVGESIMSLIVFNTNRYFPQTQLFTERLVRYAGTMPCPPSQKVLFEYVLLRPAEKAFDFIPVKEYVVDIHGEKTIEEKVLRQDILEDEKKHISPVRASVRPGSYAPTT